MSAINYEGRDLEALAAMPNYYDWIMKTFASFVSGHVIEYGAGMGTVAVRLSALADRITLVEPAPNLIKSLHLRFSAASNVEIVQNTLEVHASTVANDSVDAIVLVNVLEHIEDDQSAINQLFRIVKPGGYLLIFVPALQALMSRLDVMHGHFRRYQKRDLAAKIRSTGADLVDCRYFDMLGVLPWLVLNKWLGNTRFNPTLVRINDRVLVPISRSIECVYAPFGKNIIAVASKRPGVKMAR
jgi:SAM-dependent methyltransferase